ncbi:hypothetical protein [Aquihabitans sp. McL0605]|uniref:hypothetical protein n=1 Tax=Aquihabitans sp. McL0605 TaxID=3415671 RepID=UPI003CF7C3EF
MAAHQAGIAKARRQALDIVASTGPRLDVVADLIDPVLRTWCETWLGLPGEGLHLQRVGQLTTHTVFLNPRAPEPRVPGQGIDCDGLARCVELIAEQRARWAPMVAAAPEGSVVRALHEHPSVASPDEVTAHTVGLTVGPLALGSRAVAIAVDELLKRPEQFAAITDETAATAAFDRVLAVRPPLPGVPRRRGGHEVLALTQAAAAVAASDPAAWAFGAGPHRCMGRPQISEAAAAILLALAPTRPTRSDGPRQAPDGARTIGGPELAVRGPPGGRPQPVRAPRSCSTTQAGTSSGSQWPAPTTVRTSSSPGSVRGRNIAALEICSWSPSHTSAGMGSRSGRGDEHASRSSVTTMRR